MLRIPPTARGAAATLAAVLFLPAGALSAQEARPAPTLLAAARTGAVAIDGSLDDPAWQTAPVAEGFVQRRPDPGGAATQPTEARILFDDDALYVGMRMHDAVPDSIAAQLARRDARSIYSDWAIVMLDSYRDRRTAFAFGVNPRGVQRDFAVYGDANEDHSWDAVWQVKTRLDSAGWTAEFRIPLSQLRFSRGQNEWGLNFQRVLARRDERSFWAPYLPSVPGYVSTFGTLAGLGGLRPPRRLEAQPYVVGRVVRAPEAEDDPFFSSNDLFSSVGGDVRYGLSSDFTLAATFNPDFGQVEADPSVVNLTDYEIFFDERRPFFVEGADIFELGNFGGAQPFYSRRIGRDPQASAPGAFSDVPGVTTILGAAKLSGKTAGGWSVGLLNAVTARENARFVDADGVFQRTAVEPLTNYLVGSVIRDFQGGKSAAGMLFTATNRDLSDSPQLSFLRSSAYVGGFTARHRFGGDNYDVSGQILGSVVRGGTAAISRTQLAPGRYFNRPDAEHLSFDSTLTSLAGTAGTARLARVGGSLRWAVEGSWLSPGVELNDVGYQQGADQVNQNASISYQQFKPGKAFRNWAVGAQQQSRWSFGGEHTSTLLQVSGEGQLRNYWSGFAALNRLLPALSTDRLRGGPAFRTPALTEAVVSIAGDPRKRFAPALFGSAYSEQESGARGFRLSPEVAWRPASNVSTSLGITYRWNQEDAQFLPTASLDGPRHYLLSHLDQTTFGVTARLNLTFSPTLSLQFYGQPFVSAGKFDDFREVTDPRADRYRDRFTPVSVAYDTTIERFLADRNGDGVAEFRFRRPDFNVREFRSNAVMRWEYRPGSTLFVVWNQARDTYFPDGRFDLAGDTRGLFRVEPTNTLLIKFSYWFGL